MLSVIMLSLIMLCVIHYAKCHYAECCDAECCDAECHYAECHCAECHYPECHYAECRYAECRVVYIYHIFVQTCNKLERSSMSTTFILEQTLLGRMEPNLAEALIELHPRARVLKVPVNIRQSLIGKYSS